MWAGEDLNLHSLRNMVLNHARLPFRHPPSASTRIRTSDHLLKRELLYQLSYGRISRLLALSNQSRRFSRLPPLTSGGGSGGISRLLALSNQSRCFSRLPDFTSGLSYGRVGLSIAKKH